MIKKFESFIEESKDKNYLLYYAFDWDDNILNMPTVIHLEKRDGDNWTPVDVSTAEFAEVRGDKENYRLLNNNPDDAFSNFRDTGPKGGTIFLEDVEKAVDSQRFGPAWEDFIECLSNGALFSIITARGHEGKTLRSGVEWILDSMLSESQLFSLYNNLIRFHYLFDELGEDFPRLLKGKPSENSLIKSYLDACHFVGVSAPSRGGTPDNPEKAKEDALLEFIDQIDSDIDKLEMLTGEEWVASVGFSDDDIKNVKHVEELFDNLHNERFQNIYKVVVKGTKDPLNITKKVKFFETDTVKNEATHSTQAPGMASSVMSFTQYNNMASRLFPSNVKDNDPVANTHRLATDYLSKQSKEWTKDLNVTQRKKNKKKEK
jgi:hypothetical protein